MRLKKPKLSNASTHIKKLNPTAAPQSALAASPFDPKKMDKRTRRLYIRWGIISGNFLLLALISGFVLINRSTSQTIRSGTVNSTVTTTSSLSNPLDQLSSAEIAAQVAQLANLPERTAARNEADSQNALLYIVPNDTTTLAKPQVVSTSQKSKYDIIFYKVRKGDSINSIADKFHLTVGSITGSNTRIGTAVSPGIKLVIPPANGIVYKVRPGDTVGSIVDKYGADRSLLILVNDAEKGLSVGSYIWIPNVTEPGISLNYTRIYGLRSYTPIFGSNGYDYGFCTWYVASRITVPSNWGNANTWDDYARLTAGWSVSLKPTRVGAIGQSDAGSEGHVGVIDAVSADGTKIKYSDMNGLAGWGRVGSSGWVDASRFQHYIYKS